MNATNPGSFYVTGGHVPPESPSYVPRRADSDLLEHLLRGTFCYILTTRQLGKSSLMAQTVRRLREQKVTAVVLDLSAQGYNLTADQWYNGLLEQLGYRLDLDHQIERYCQDHTQLSPIQRWQIGLRDVVLKEVRGQVVIFIDEIDVVRSLRFSTDEFFAAIRSCYNARTEDPNYVRLTFCLLGVATPSDLITNPNLTPFNCGTRIDLLDFTLDEASLLQYGLGRDSGTSELLMRRIYYWTGGHPCLTQRLSKAVSEDASVITESGVDRLCRQIFLEPLEAKRDDNLAYVRQRVLVANDNDRAALLTMYSTILAGKSVLDNGAGELVGRLKLSGIVCTHNGRLRVRNRIYACVFDRTWISDNMPDAEKRRQQYRAYRKRLVRTAITAIIALGIIGALLASMIYREQVNAATQRQLKEQAREYSYSADMYVLQSEWDKHHDGRAVDLIRHQRPGAGEIDLRGWEWRYVWKQAHGNRATIRSGKSIVFGVAYSPDGKFLATGNGDQTVRVFDARSGSLLHTLSGHTDNVLCVAFSPDGTLLASCGDDNTMRLWDMQTHRQIGAAMSGRFCVAFSPDGRTIACSSGDSDHTVRLWDVETHRQVGGPIPQGNNAYALAFSPDGKMLATGGAEFEKRPDGVLRHVIRIWDLAQRVYQPMYGSEDAVFALAYSKDGKRLALEGENYSIDILDLVSGKKVSSQYGHNDSVSSIAFAADGRSVASGSWDTSTKFWNASTGKLIREFRGQPDKVTSIAFSPDGKSIATASRPEVRIWDTADDPESPQLLDGNQPMEYVKLSKDTAVLPGLAGPIFYRIFPGGRPMTSALAQNMDDHGQVIGYSAIAYSPDGKYFAAAVPNSGAYSVTVWNLVAQQKMYSLVHGSQVSALAFCPTPPLLATADNDHYISIWDLRTQRRLSYAIGDTNLIHSMAFTKDGKLLVTGGWTGTIKVWEIIDKRLSTTPKQNLTGYGSAVTSIAMSRDGKTMATAGNSEHVTLWNVATMREMITLKAPQKILAIAFTADGNSLIGVGGEQTRKVYEWSTPSLQEINRRQ